MKLSYANDFIIKWHDAIRANQMQFFRLHYGNSNYNSKIYFLRRHLQKGGWKNYQNYIYSSELSIYMRHDLTREEKIHLLTRIAPSTGEVIYSGSFIYKMIQNIVNSFTSKDNIYLSANGYNSAKKRISKNIAVLQNIVIDIDGHSISSDMLESSVDRLHYFLVQDLFNDPAFPTPNTVVFTGRGIQLWYAIKGCSAELESFYKLIAGKLAECYSSFLIDHPIITDFRVDSASSLKISGLFRMPWTYNHHTGKYGTMDIVHDAVYDIHDIQAMLSIPNITANKDTKQSSNHHPAKSSGKLIAGKNRVAALYKLLALRGPECTGLRNNYLFCFYNAYLMCGLSHELIMDKIYLINAQFASPLPEREVKGYMSSIQKYKYQLTNKRIIELLDISVSEQEQTGIIDLTPEKQARVDRKKEKESRNQAIIAYYQMECPQDYIALQTGCSQATVSRVIKKFRHSNSTDC